MKTKLYIALFLCLFFAAGNYLGYHTYDIGLSREDRLTAQSECADGGCAVVPNTVLYSLIKQLMQCAQGGRNGSI